MSKKMFWSLVLLGPAVMAIGILLDLAIPGTIFGTALLAVGAVVSLAMLLIAPRSRRRQRMDEIQAHAAQQGNIAVFHNNDFTGTGI